MTKRVEHIITLLQDRYQFKQKNDEPFRVLISTILSQRTRDKVTEEVSEHLFSRYKTPKEIARARPDEITSLIKGVGFYNIKAERIKEVASILIKRWNSSVPSELCELLSLPGVGRKTANCVLVYGFGIPALPVDTHVHRITNRLGLVATSIPEETEKSLTKIIPKKYWGWLNFALVQFGKEICKPIKPLCGRCKLSKKCGYKKSNVQS